jgi:hypothetical protein
MKWLVRAVVLSGLFALAPAAPAAAQVYPIPPVTPCASTPSPVDLGTRNVGEFFGTVVCGPWSTPQNVTAEINGAVFQKPVNSDGAVSVTVQITSPTTATVNPQVPIHCGVNTINLSGTGAGGGITIKQVLFSLNCNQFGQPFVPPSFFPGAAFPGQFPGAVPYGQNPMASLFGPTFNPSVSNQEQQQQQSVVVPAGSSTPAATPAAAAAPAAATQGRVAFTGANVVRWSIAALALMGVGALLVLHSRRRRPLLS